MRHSRARPGALGPSAAQRVRRTCKERWEQKKTHLRITLVLAASCSGLRGDRASSAKRAWTPALLGQPANGRGGGERLTVHWRGATRRHRTSLGSLTFARTFPIEKRRVAVGRDAKTGSERSTNRGRSVQLDSGTLADAVINMKSTRFPRLRDALGADVEALSAADLERAVVNKVQESFDLEFKAVLYPPTDGGRHELAEDVAAIANTRGGLVVLGIKDANGRAEALIPVAVSDGEDRRMRNVIADLVFPQPDWYVRQIVDAGSGGSGFYALVIHPSALKPHGVFINRKNLRYPVRDQTRNRFLSESEVADAYRGRFRQAEEDKSRLHQVHDDGCLPLEPVREVWATLALVPVVRGRMPISRAKVEELRQRVWSRANEDLLSGWTVLTLNPPVEIATGLQRIVLIQQREADGKPIGAYVELHSDGSGFFRFELRTETKTLPDVRWISRKHLVASLSGMILNLVEHAVDNTGAYGDALVMGTFLRPRHSADHLYRLGLKSLESPFPSNKPHVFPMRVPISQHTLSLDVSTGDARERLLASRAIIGDLFQAFGEPELGLISDDGKLSRALWSDADIQHVAKALRLSQSEIGP